jgi:opacity protein-like surface antigen
MKRGWMGLLLLAVGFALPAVCHGQASVYGDFSVNRLFSGDEQHYLYGATTGVVVDGPHIHKLFVSADIQGRFLGKNGERLDGVTVGPRFSITMQRSKLTPFAEFMVGFERYSAVNISSTTDYTFQVNAGVARQLSPHWDAEFIYSYSQFGYNTGEFNPKTFSVGAVYHFNKR